MPHDLDIQPFQLDHIRAQKHAGPTTIDVLRINLLERVEHRRLLIAAGVFSTADEA